MPHNLHDKYTAMRGCRCMDTVNTVCCNIHCALEAEGHIRTPDIIINSFRKMNNIQPFFPQKVGCLLSSVSAKNNQAIQIQLAVILLHGSNLVQSVLVRNPHTFKGLSGASQNRTALCQNSGEISSAQKTVFIINQSFVSLFNTINLHIAA